MRGVAGGEGGYGAAMSDCIFCSIAKGWAPATVRAEDEEFIAFDDLFPKAEQHVLVIPREHHLDLDAWLAAGGSSDRLLRFVTHAAAEAGVAGNYRVIANTGRQAGQMIDHLHLHVMSGGLSAF